MIQFLWNPSTPKHVGFCGLLFLHCSCIICRSTANVPNAVVALNEEFMHSDLHLTLHAAHLSPGMVDSNVHSGSRCHPVDEQCYTLCTP